MSFYAKVQNEQEAQYRYDISNLNTSCLVRYVSHNCWNDSSTYNGHYQERGCNLRFFTKPFDAQCKYRREHNRHEERHNCQCVKSYATLKSHGDDQKQDTDHGIKAQQLGCLDVAHQESSYKAADHKTYHCQRTPY